MLTIDRNNKVTVDPETLRIEAFNTIWEKDTSKNKDKALDIFAYIYFKYNPKSAYRKSALGKELQEKLLKEVIKNPKWKIPEYVKKAENIYKENMNSIGMRLLQSALTAAERISNLFEDFELDEIEDESKRIDVAVKMLSGLDKVDSVVLKITTATKKLEEEFTANKNKKSVSRFEKPKNKR
jgi:hypothetical protein